MVNCAQFTYALKGNNMGGLSGIVDMVVIWLVHFLQTSEGQALLTTIENEILAMAEAQSGQTTPTPATPATSPTPATTPATPATPTVFAFQRAGIPSDSGVIG